MGARASEPRASGCRRPLPGYLYLHGISVEMAEPSPNTPQSHPRRMVSPDEDASTNDEMLNQGYRGIRYSFGYPACPNLRRPAPSPQKPPPHPAPPPLTPPAPGQKKGAPPLFYLLFSAEIGLTLSEEYQLDPDKSRSAIVLTTRSQVFFGVTDSVTPKNFARHNAGRDDEHACRCAS